jgi:hypothetical protein
MPLFCLNQLLHNDKQEFTSSMRMYSVILPAIIASLCATGCSLLLVRRGPSPRLRYLTLTVGLMSFAQTANLLHIQGVWTGGSLYVVHVHQSLVAGLSLLAMYLLGVEIYDRNFTDRRLRLAEHELLMANGMQSTEVQPFQPPQQAEEPQPFGLIALAGHVGFSRGLAMETTLVRCEACLNSVYELAASWQELYAARVERRAEDAALERLVKAQRTRLQHESASGHAVIDKLAATPDPLALTMISRP